jgi:hypothetical protein
MKRRGVGCLGYGRLTPFSAQQLDGMKPPFTANHPEEEALVINPTASMKMGERYSVEQIGDTHPITRFFLDGKYFSRP